MNKFDLDDYWERFPGVLKDRYGKDFEVDRTSEVVFTSIEKTFAEVRSGRGLTIDDVMAIFGADLPFFNDWTTPDPRILDKRMTDKDVNVADAIKDLRGDYYNLELITKIWRGFRELSLTSLVLHHVYPTHFAMCSHHLASLLYVTAPKVPEYYIKYCTELREWSKTASDTANSAVKTEFALWTWYRLAHFGKPVEKKKHHQAFFTDSWVQQRRAWQIAESLKEGNIGLLDFARSFLDSQPIVAAMIAWREFENAARYVVGSSNDKNTPRNIYNVIRRLPLSDSEKEALWSLWEPLRNDVMHNDLEIKKKDAEKVLTGVEEFIRYHVAGRNRKGVQSLGEGSQS
jgi:hypothetical protein